MFNANICFLRTNYYLKFTITFIPVGKETKPTSECGKSLTRIEVTGILVILAKASSVSLATVDGRICLRGS